MNAVCLIWTVEDQKENNILNDKMYTYTYMQVLSGKYIPC